jgi:hypothetical protein
MDVIEVLKDIRRMASAENKPWNRNMTEREWLNIHKFNKISELIDEVINQLDLERRATTKPQSHKN